MERLPLKLLLGFPETKKQIAEVQIQSLRREKNQVKEVLSGLECGITFLKFNDLLENDKIEFFIRENNEKK